MNASFPLLEKVFQEIPTYGYGSINTLKRSRRRFIWIMKEVSEEPRFQSVTADLTAKAHGIGKLIALAMAAKTKNQEKIHFDKASNELAMHVEELMRAMQQTCTVNSSY